MHNFNTLDNNPDNDLPINHFAIPPAHSSLSKYCLPDRLIYHVQQVQNPFLSILHLNIRSLPANHLKLGILIQTIGFRFDVIAISETWLSGNNFFSFPIPGYNFISSHRQTRGGGVGMYIKSAINFQTVEKWSTCCDNSHESLCIKLPLTGHKCAMVMCAYRAPSYNPETFIDEFLSPFLQENNRCNLIICGDLNLNLLDKKNKAANNCVELIESFGLTHLINLPTRITKDTASLLDNIFTNMLSSQPTAKILIEDISDHLPVLALFPQYSCQTNVKPLVDRYLLNDHTLATFFHKLQSENLDALYSADLNLYYNNLIMKIQKTARDCFTPAQKTRHFTLKIPWLTEELVLASRWKNALYKKYQADHNPESFENYKRFRNCLNSELRSARKTYIANQLFKHKSNTRKIWQILNSLLTNKSKRANEVTCLLNADGTTITNQVAIANNLNNYFASVGSKISLMFTPQIVNANEYKKYLSNPPQDSFALPPCTEYDIKKAYESLKSSSSFDTDDLNKKMFDRILDLIITPITNIINMSFQSGVFPKAMKTAKVTAIFKSGDHRLASNYRPISILPVLSKVIEKIVNNKLVSFLFSRNLITSCQYGFLPGRSTVLASVDLFETVCESLKNRENTVAISLDLSKAFDSLDHNILLEKLPFYGIRGLPLQWFTSYLSNRSQIVSLNNNHIKSDPKCLTHGVPQGSILGPTLFLLYINDLPRSSNILKFILYADDTTLLFSFKQNSNPSQVLQNEIDKVVTWFQLNKLLLNKSKTQAVIYSHSPAAEPELSINLSTNKITFIQNLNFLGITFDSKLNFKPHIDKIRQQISRSLGFLYRVKNFIPTKYKKQLYYSLVHPHLNYGIVLWGNMPKSTIKPLESLQNRAIKFVANAKFRNASAPIYKNLAVANIKQLHFQNLNQMMHQAFHSQLPPTIQILFQRPLTTRTRGSNLNLVVRRRSTRLQDCRPSVNGPFVWNNLPDELKKLKSQTFQCKIKAYALTQTL